MAKNFGLGRGLSSLIPQANNDTRSDEDFNADRSEDLSAIESILDQDDNDRIVHVSPFEIKINPYQPRKDFNRRELEELIESIREHGIIQPLVVVTVEDNYQLIAGERRLRASKILELETVPVILREADSVDQLEIALIENIQRSQLNPLEEALAYRRLADEFSFTQEQIAKKVGKSRPTVANTMRLLKLPDEVKEALSSGRITLSHAKAILSAPSEGEQRELYQKCLVGDMNVIELNREARKVNTKINRNVKDLDLEVKEDKLRQILGTKVYIKKRGDHGRVEIEFYSEEDLEKIVGQICN